MHVRPYRASLLAFVAAAGAFDDHPRRRHGDGFARLPPRRDRAPARRRGSGVCAGLFVWGAGAAFGLNALLAASSAAFAALKWVGRGLSGDPRPATAPQAARGPCGRRRSATGAVAAFRRGFLTNVLNPKVGVFYATFLPQFIPAGVNVAAFSLLLAGVHAALTLLWFAALIA